MLDCAFGQPQVFGIIQATGTSVKVSTGRFVTAKALARQAITFGFYHQKIRRIKSTGKNRYRSGRGGGRDAKRTGNRPRAWACQ